ncbi:hypothetical protein HMPREF9370_0249 [Neisseria wadsworthii 9715]|uniref:Uncharacterized protein n=1 Tax=Neisseria wadsworthii 9715 TaxID=1030841 RepID=G4CME0_9NEIS|nr:hypothetical protein HMPREF9370_0249 [Neisseria wadsworthii 9715]
MIQGSKPKPGQIVGAVAKIKLIDYNPDAPRFGYTWQPNCKTGASPCLLPPIAIYSTCPSSNTLYSRFTKPVSNNICLSETVFQTGMVCAN